VVSAHISFLGEGSWAAATNSLTKPCGGA